MGDSNFNWLERFSDAVALIEENGREISYRQLVELCRDVQLKAPPTRQVVLLEARNDVASVAAYLACLEAGHCVILVGDDGGNGHRRIVDAFRPGLLWRNGVFKSLSVEPAPTLHQELALLLPTSGSTGSPKLVRLSRASLDANADSIIKYLNIGPTDRAIASLPIHYSFGLSVLNSHLRAGASVVLTDLSVTNPAFWTLFRDTRATSFAGVPYSYELLERINFRDNPPETLRTMTQAGGKLAPDLVAAYATFGDAIGMRFYTMYGQTEAAPRMAYLPPELAAENPDCVGVAIPGGSFHLIDDNGAEITRPDVAGELVYRGPNVMLGYAFTQDDLGKGREVTDLRTGDLAVRTRRDLYKIVGRASRFVKIAGLRIGLDDVEVMASELSRDARAAGSDGLVAICLSGESDAAAVRDYVARRCGLPASAVFAFNAPEIPRLASGKVDYASILKTGVAMVAAEAKAAEQNGAITAAFAKALGIPAPPPEASFSSLGGDSLSYVNASIGVERVLGRLPEAWETMSIASLEAMAPSDPAPAQKSGWIGTEMLVRLGALSLVLIGHSAPDDTVWLRGGSNILFALAGFSLARFQRESLLKGQPAAAILGSLYRVILPYLVLVALLLPTSEADKSIGWPLLISVFTVDFRGPLFAYWFIESVFHALLIASALFMIPAVRTFARQKPFASGIVFVAGALVLKLGLPPIWNDGRAGFHLTVDALLYTYFLGWTAYLARTTAQKLVVVGIAAVVAGLDYGVPNPREFWLTLGLLAILFVPRVRMPTLAGRVVLTLASASYFIYLTHVLVVHVVIHVLKQHDPAITIPTILIGSAVAGLAYSWGWNLVVPRVFAAARGLVHRRKSLSVGAE